MKFKLKAAFIISRFANILVFIGGLIILWEDRVWNGSYFPWAIFFLVSSIFSIIWGILGAIGKFDETVLGNMAILIELIAQFMVNMSCFINGFWYFDPIILIGSVPILIGIVCGFFLDIVMFASYGHD